MKSPRTIAVTLLLGDALCLLLFMNVVGMLRGVIPVTAPLLWPLIGPLVLLVGAIYLIDGYKPRTSMLSLDYTSQHLIAIVAALATTLLLTFVVVPSGFPLQQSRAVIALGFLVLAPATLGLRRAVQLRTTGASRLKPVIFAGDSTSCREFQAECERMKLPQPVIAAAVDSGGADSPASLSTIITDIEQGRIHAEAIVLRESRHEPPGEVSQRLVRLYFSGLPTYTLELFHQVYWRKIPLYRLNQTWLFQEGFQIAREPVFERLKRLSDVAFALVGLTLAAPFLVASGIAIKLTDRGPMFFRQTRIGRNRAPFSILKLRTMRVQSGGSRYTQQNDTRITPVGRFLRASRLDEVPQLWNVLIGQMSLIGPRAEWDELVRDYEAQIPCYHFRHLVKPGITGWAQINYPYGAGIEDTLRKLEYDLYYIRHFSFTLDASIVLKTIHVMLFGKGQ